MRWTSLTAVAALAGCQGSPDAVCPGERSWDRGVIDGTEGWIPREVATSGREVWIAGPNEDGWLLAHFDGAMWSVEPFEGGPEERSIVALWAGDGGEAWLATLVYAGNPIWHREGGEWQRAPRPPRTLSAISGMWSSGQGDLWVTDSDDLYRLHDGEWTAVYTADPGVSLAAICGTSASDVWVVEATFVVEQTLIHWDGQRWEKEPLPPDLFLSSLTCTDSGLVAIANLESGDAMLARWSAGAWSLEAPLGEANATRIGRLFVRSDDDIWLSGTVALDEAPDEFEEHVAHYDGCDWSSRPDVVDLAHDNWVADWLLTGLADGRTWIIGATGLTLQLGPL